MKENPYSIKGMRSLRFVSIKHTKRRLFIPLINLKSNLLEITLNQIYNSIEVRTCDNSYSNFYDEMVSLVFTVLLFNLSMIFKLVDDSYGYDFD